MKTINLADIPGTEILCQAPNGRAYKILVSQTPVFVVYVPSILDRASAVFDSQKVMARVPRVHEYKHYHPKRGKFWTSRPGIDILFAIPRGRIEVILDEPGYSYVPVLIGGTKFVVNTSGGTSGGGWTDWFPTNLHLSGTASFTLKKMRCLADAALYPNHPEIPWPEIKIEPEEDQRFVRLVAEKTVPSMIKQGNKIVAAPGCSYLGETEFSFDHRRKDRRGRPTKEFVVNTNGQGWLRVSLTQIDWKQTAKANNIRFEVPRFITRKAA